MQNFINFHFINDCNSNPQSLSNNFRHNNQLQRDDKFDSSNLLEAHYEDPELNTFIDGIAEGVNAMDLKGSCTLLIRYPVKLKNIFII